MDDGDWFGVRTVLIDVESVWYGPRRIYDVEGHLFVWYEDAPQYGCSFDECCELAAGGVRQSDIARMLGISRQCVSRFFKRMNDRGLR